MDYHEWVQRLRQFVLGLRPGTNDLENYRNPETGFLDATTAQAVVWRERLGLGA